MNTLQSVKIWEFINSYVDIVTALSPAIFSLPTLILFPSLESVALVMFGIVIGSIFYYIVLIINDNKTYKECLLGFLNPFRNCIYTEYSIENFSSPDSIIVYETDGMKAQYFGYNFRLKLKRRVRIFVVKRGDSTIIPNQLVAYGAFARTPSLIFVRDEPEKIKLLGKFFIYHEVGHSSFQGELTRRLSQLGWKFYILPIFWGLFYLRQTVWSYILLSIYVLLLFIIFLLFKYFFPRYSRLVEEQGADQFSICCLSPEEQMGLIKLLINAGHLPYDSTISLEQNKERYNLLLNNLAELQGEYNFYKEPIAATFLPIESFCLLILSIFIPILGFLSRKPPTSIYCTNSIIILILLTIAVALQFKRDSLKAEIEGITNKNPA